MVVLSFGRELYKSGSTFFAVADVRGIRGSRPTFPKVAYWFFPGFPVAAEGVEARVCPARYRRSASFQAGISIP